MRPVHEVTGHPYPFAEVKNVWSCALELTQVPSSPAWEKFTFLCNSQCGWVKYRP